MAKIIYKNYFEFFVCQKNISAVGRDLGLGLSDRQTDKTGMTQEKIVIIFTKKKSDRTLFRH